MKLRGAGPVLLREGPPTLNPQLSTTSPHPCTLNPQPSTLTPHSSTLIVSGCVQEALLKALVAHRPPLITVAIATTIVTLLLVAPLITVAIATRVVYYCLWRRSLRCTSTPLENANP